MSIKIENLTHIYSPNGPFEKKALDNVSLEINDGDFVAIIGHTGSGKSTLIQHMNGLEKATSGKIFIDDVDITAKDIGFASNDNKVTIISKDGNLVPLEKMSKRSVARTLFDIIMEKR